MVTTCTRCGRESPEDFEFCPACGASLAPPAYERRKTVTVLFCNLTGSTALGERTDPEALRALMGRYYETARVVLEQSAGPGEILLGDDTLRLVRDAVTTEAFELSLKGKTGVVPAHRMLAFDPAAAGVARNSSAG